MKPNPFAGMTAAEIVRQSVLHPRYARQQRNVRIRAMRKDGATFQEIGRAFGMTRQRVQQIVAEAA